MKRLILCALILLLTAGVALAKSPVPDPDPNNKPLDPQAVAEAQKYVALTDYQNIISQNMTRFVDQLPPELREIYLHDLDQWVKGGVMDEIHAALAKSLAMHLTVKEIKALNAFYGSEEGKAIRQKFPLFLADQNNVLRDASMGFLQDFIQKHPPKKDEPAAQQGEKKEGEPPTPDKAGEAKPEKKAAE